MQIIIEIPDEDIPKNQKIIDIHLHFIDGHIVDADGYGFAELPRMHGDLIDRDLALSDDELCKFHMYDDYVKMRDHLKSIPPIILRKDKEIKELDRSIATSFLFGTAFGFASKYDEKDKILKNIREIIDGNEVMKQEPCEDAISRQAVLEYIYNDLGLGDEENGKDVERQMELEKSYKYVKSLKPVNPQTKTGHWIIEENVHYGTRTLRCSSCNTGFQFIREYKYCPNCGCRMVEPQERSGEE